MPRRVDEGAIGDDVSMNGFFSARRLLQPASCPFVTPIDLLVDDENKVSATVTQPNLKRLFYERAKLGRPGEFHCCQNLQIRDQSATSFSCDVVKPGEFYKQFGGKDVVIYVHGAFTHPKHVLWETQLLQGSLQSELDSRGPDARSVAVIPFMWPCNTANVLDVMGLPIVKSAATDTLPLFHSRYKGDGATARATSETFHAFLQSFLEHAATPTCDHVPEDAELHHSLSLGDAGSDFVNSPHHLGQVPDCGGRCHVPRSITVVAHSIGNYVLTYRLPHDRKLPLKLRGIVLNAADVETSAVLAPSADGRSHLEVLACEADTVLVTFNKYDVALRIAPVFDSIRRTHRLGREGVPKADGKAVFNIPDNVISMDCSGFASQFDAGSGHNYHLTRDYRWSLELYYRDITRPLSFLLPNISNGKAESATVFGDASPVVAAIVDVIDKKLITKG